MWEEDFSQLRSVLWEEFSLDALGSALTECEIKDPIVKKNLWNYIEQAKKLNPKQSEVWWEEAPELPSRWKGIDLLNKPEDPTIQLLATSFIELPTGQDGQPNFEADMQTAFDKAVSITTLGKSFPQGEAYDIALKDIHSGDLETKLSALTYITSLVNTEQAKGWMKNKQDFQKAKTIHTNKKKAYLDFKIEQLNTQIAETNDQEKKDKLWEEYTKLLQEKEVEDFPESGEMFAGTDFETNSEDA